MPESSFVSLTVPIHVDDFEKGVEFYSGLFGRKPDAVPDYGIADWKIAPNCRVHVFSNPGQPITFYLDVPDVKAFYESIRGRLGLEPEGELYKYGWGFCLYKDPWGNQIGIYKSRDV